MKKVGEWGYVSCLEPPEPTERPAETSGCGGESGASSLSVVIIINSSITTPVRRSNYYLLASAAARVGHGS